MSTTTSDSIWMMSFRVCVVVGLIAASLVLVFPQVADFTGDILNGTSTGGTTPQDKKAPSSPAKGANADSKSSPKASPSIRPEWSNPAEAPQLAPSFAKYRPETDDSNDSAAKLDASVKPASASMEVPSKQTSLQSYRAELKQLGATYVVVEQVEDSDLFECRCLASMNSKYSKAFSAQGPTANKAAAKLVEQVKQWRRTQSRVASSESKATPTGSQVKSPAKTTSKRSPKKVER